MLFFFFRGAEIRLFTRFLPECYISAVLQADHTKYRTTSVSSSQLIPDMWNLETFKTSGTRLSVQQQEEESDEKEEESEAERGVGGWGGGGELLLMC